MRNLRGIPYIILAILLLLPFHRVVAGGGYLTGIDSYVPSVQPFASQFPDARPGPWLFSARMDGLAQTIPSKSFTQEELKAGRIPHWNPYIFCGTPHQADMYSQVFSITDTPFLYFMSVDAALTVASILKLLLLSLGMFLLARRFGIRWEFACISSIAMCMNFQQLHWLIIPAFLSTVLYLPWMFLAWDKYMRGGGLSWMFLCGILGGLSALGGQMQLFVSIWIILFLYTLFGRTYHGRKTSAGSIIAIIASFLSAILIAFVQILPGLQFAMLAHGGEDISPLNQLTASIGWIFTSGWKQVIINFIRLFAPYDYSPANMNYYSTYKELVIYIGLLSPAIIAALWRIKRTPLMNYLWWVSIVSMLLMVFNVVAVGLLSVFPFTQFQSLRRMVSLVFFFHMSLLLPYTLQYIISNADSRLLLRLRNCVALAMIPLGLYLLYCLRLHIFDSQPLDWNQGIYIILFYGISIVIGIIYLIFLRPKYINRITLPLIILLIFFVEMWNYGSHQIEVDRIHSDQLISNPIELKAGRVIRGWGDSAEVYTPNTGMLSGIYDAQGYFPLNKFAYRRLYESIFPDIERDSRIVPLPPNYRNAIPLLDMLGVNQVLSSRRTRRDGTYMGESTCIVYSLNDGEDVTEKQIWGTIFDKADRIESDDFYKWLGQDKLYLKEFAYVTGGENLKVSPDPIPFSTGARITAEENEPGRITVSVERVLTGSILMYPENNYPGWRVYVDGQNRELLTIDGTFLGVQLDEGDRKIEFIFNPVAFRIGLIISIVSLTLVSLLFILIGTVPIFPLLISQAARERACRS